MPRLISAIRETILFKIPTHRKPMQMGNYETVLPAPTRAISFGEILEVPTDAAQNVLAKKGLEGLVVIGDKKEVGDGLVAGETDEAAFRRAKRVRLTFLRAKINHFRNHNAWLRAQNIPVLLPSERLRDRMEEFEGLAKEIDGALLADGDPTGMGPTPMTPDRAADELAKFGLPSGSMPLVPGVEDALSGVGSLDL